MKDFFLIQDFFQSLLFLVQPDFLFFLYYKDFSKRVYFWFRKLHLNLPKSFLISFICFSERFIFGFGLRSIFIKSFSDLSLWFLMFLLFAISFNSFNDEFIGGKKVNFFYNNLGICRVIIYFTVGLNNNLR